MSDSITSQIQELDVGNRIELWEFDFRVADLDLDSQYYTPSFDKSPGLKIVYDGQNYDPVQMYSSGFSYDGTGKLPTPTITFSNVFQIFSDLNYQYDDMSGVQCTKTVTFEKFLDLDRNGDPNPDADTEAHLPIERFRVNRKTQENELEVSYELSAAIDQEGQKIPRRQYIRNFCPLSYRRYDAEADALGLHPFNYKNVTCPYTYLDYFNENNQSVANPSEDKCPRTLAGCRARYGTSFFHNEQWFGEELPFGGFPGLVNFPT